MPFILIGRDWTILCLILRFLKSAFIDNSIFVLNSKCDTTMIRSLVYGQLVLSDKFVLLKAAVNCSSIVRENHNRNSETYKLANVFSHLYQVALTLRPKLYTSIGFPVVRKIAIFIEPIFFSILCEHFAILYFKRDFLAHCP